MGANSGTATNSSCSGSKGLLDSCLLPALPGCCCWEERGPRARCAPPSVGVTTPPAAGRRTSKHGGHQQHPATGSKNSTHTHSTRPFLTDTHTPFNSTPLAAPRKRTTKLGGHQQHPATSSKIGIQLAPIQLVLHSISLQI